MLINGNVPIPLYPVPLFPARDFKQELTYLYNESFKFTVNWATIAYQIPLIEIKVKKSLQSSFKFYDKI